MVLTLIVSWTHLLHPVTLILIQDHTYRYMQYYPPSSNDAEASTAVGELQRVQPADFCMYVGQLQPVNDDERLTKLQNDYRPDKTYKSPAHLEYGRCRSFQRCRLEEYSWLVYSPTQDGANCKMCVLFWQRNS